MARTAHKEAASLSVMHNEPPVESATVDDTRQTDIEASMKAEFEHDLAVASSASVVASSVAPALAPARRGRKPRSDTGTPRKPRAAAVPMGPKMVPAPVPVGTVPHRPCLSVSAALEMIEPGTEMTILGATWQEINAAADELGIRAFIWTRQTEHGVDVDHRAHGDEADTDAE